MITGTSNFDEIPHVRCPVCGGYYKADEPEIHECQGGIPMSNINKQALREAAERAASDSWGYVRDEFNEAITPEVVLALLDELEAAEKSNVFLKGQLAELANFNPDWDKLEASYESWREIAAELLVANDRIAELELKLEAADKLQDSAFRHGLQHGFSYGQTDNQAGFEQAIQAYGQQWKGE